MEDTLIETIFSNEMQAGLDAINNLNFHSFQLMVGRFDDAAFSNMEWNNKIYLVGAGGIGMNIADMLPIHIIGNANFYIKDPDKIETSNLKRIKTANLDVGEYKVIVAAAKIGQFCGLTVVNHSSPLDCPQLNYVTILATDTPESRLLELFHARSKYYIHTSNSRVFSHSFVIDGTSKMQVMAYVTYLLGAYILEQQTSEQEQVRGSCSNTTDEPQTCMANANSAMDTIRLLDMCLNNTSTPLILWENMPALFASNYQSGTYSSIARKKLLEYFNNIGQLATARLSTSLIDNLKQSTQNLFSGVQN